MMKHTEFLRRSAALLTSVFLLAQTFAVGVHAEEDESSSETGVPFESGDYTYSLLTSSEDASFQAACIEGYSGKDADVVIPDTIGGLEVLMIGDYAFTSCYTMKTVTLPATLEQIGKYAFAECTNLEEYIVAPGSADFETVDGVLYTDGCATLLRYPLGKKPETVKIPESVTKIGSVAFACAEYLTELTLPETLEEIGDSAFSECKRLTKVDIPDSVTIIQPFAFNSCAMLREVKLSSALTEIGAAAFAATAISEITLPDTLTTVGEQAFAATNLKEVHIPSTVTDIGFSAFGWKRNSLGELVTVDDFVIYGAYGSAAHGYAADTENGNGFRFEIENAPESSSSAADEKNGAENSASPADPLQEGEAGDSDMSVYRIIGIVCCCVLLVLIFVAAALSGKKDKQAQKKKPEAKEKPAKEDKQDEK